MKEYDGKTMNVLVSSIVPRLVNGTQVPSFLISCSFDSDGYLQRSILSHVVTDVLLPMSTTIYGSLGSVSSIPSVFGDCL